MRKHIMSSLLLVSLLLTGCGMWNLKPQEQKREPLQQNSADFDWKGYQKVIYQDKILIKDCIANYQKDTEEMKQKGSAMLDFSACEFESIDEVEDVSVLREQTPDVAPEQSVNTIKQWLKDIHMDNIDTDKDFRDASGQYPSDESRGNSYYWLAVADYYPNFKTGSGFFVNTNQCHIQMGTEIYSMSDGTITQYLGENGMAGLDAMGGSSEGVREEGFVAELKEKSWKMLSGKLTVDEGAEIVKGSFEEEKYFPVVKGVSIEAPEVSVFALKNKYGYDCKIRHRYEGIPFAYGDSKQRNFYEDYEVAPDIKHVYVVNGQRVSVYVEQSESSELKKIAIIRNICIFM